MSIPISSSGFSTKWTGSGSWKSWWTSDKKEKRYKSSLGYSSSSFYDYTSTSYYGTYKTKYTNTEDNEAVEKLLTASYRAVREAVVILDFPFRVEVCFSSKTFLKKVGGEARKIFLPTRSLDDRNRTDADKIDVLCGTGIHEAAHLKYTMVKVLEGFIVSKTPLTRALVNLIEDERVEDKLLKERPGYESYITKKKAFDYLNLSNPTGKYIKVVSDIFKFIRFRTEINIESIEDQFSYLFAEVDEQLKDGIYSSESTNTKTSCQIASSLEKFIIDSLRDKHGATDSDIDFLQSWISKAKESYYDMVLSGQDEYSTLVSASYLDSKRTRLVTEDTMRVLEKLACGGYIRDGKTIIMNDIEGNFPRYMEIREEISPLVAPLKRILVAQNKNYDFTIHGCRSGLLDTTKLAEAYQGIPQVYTRLGHVRTNKTAVCILVDESGSMCIESRCGVRKSSIARKTSILFNEAFGNIPGVELYIYGHSADELSDGDTILRVYREPGRKTDRYALTQIGGREENRDGDAILSTAKRIRSLTDSNCTMFVVSDGSPCASGYWGYSAIRDTRAKIKKAQDMGFNIIGICIDNVPSMNDMYDTFIDISIDLSRFPSRLGKIVKKAIMENRSTITT